MGTVLWCFVLRSGIHGSIAGVVLALTIPLHAERGRPDDLVASPLHRLEHGLHRWVAFAIIPIFGFANAGVSFAGVTTATLTDPLTLGSLVGKLVGVFGSAALVIRFDLADLPKDAGWWQLLGVSVLCGIGFTMSLFIGMLAFADAPSLQSAVKVGILGGSILAGLIGWTVLRVAPREIRQPRAAAR